MATKTPLLKDAIRSAGHIQLAVAADAGINPTDFNQICTGKVVPSPKQLNAIRKALRMRRITFDLSPLFERSKELFANRT